MVILSPRRPPSVTTYVVSVVAIAALVVYLAARFDPWFADPKPTLDIVAFVLIGFGLEAAQHRLILGAATGSIAFVVYMSAALVFGPTWCAIIAALSVASAQILSRRPPVRIAFNLAQNLLALIVGTTVYAVLGGEVPPTTLSTTVVPFFGLAVTYFAINSTAVSGVIALSEAKRFSEVWTSNTLGLAGYDFVASGMGLAIAWLYMRVGFWGIVAVVIPIIFVRHTYSI